MSLLQKYSLLFTTAAYIPVHFRLDFIMEANHLNPDQTDMSSLGPYCLQYWLPKNISRKRKQTTKVVTGGKKDKSICADIK